MPDIVYKKEKRLEKVKCISRHCFNHFTPIYPDLKDNLYCLHCERKFAKESKQLNKMIDNKYSLAKILKNQ